LKPTSTLFDDYLARLERGEATDFGSLCAENPEQADELRRLEELRTSVALAEKPTQVSLFRAREGAKTALHGAWNLAEGRILGDFRLVKCIGRGGMGEVWETEQLSLSRRVALKVLLPERVDTRNLDYFAREARAGGKLAHPGIVAVYGTGETEGVHWIAMELVQENCDLGHSLDGWREAEEVGAEYYAHVAGFVAKLADAIEAAHAAGVIHRDLKPSNVLVTPDDCPKLTDFGLAKLVHEQSLSMVGEVAGTYYYMSPEQVALKHAGIDHRTDIFSLGVVLYEMLTLVRPFSGDTSEQVARKILWEEAPDPRNIRSRTPRDLAVICAKAMEKEPGRRYQTMEELAADLRRHLAHEPILATPSGALVRLQKWSRRNPTKSVAGGVGVVALVAISVLAWKLNLKRTALAETNEQLQTKTTEAEGSASLATQRADALAQANEQLEAKTAEAEASASLAIRRADELVQANDALSAERSEAEAARAEAAAQRDQAEKRAEELQQVSEFQASQLWGVDAEAMGQTIRTMVLERARAAGEQAGREQQVLAEEQETLKGLLDGADFTGLALGVLDQEVFERALEELEEFDNQPMVQVRLLSVVALTFHRLGLSDRGLETQRRVVAISRRELGNEHPDTLTAIGNLAEFRKELGEYEESEQLWRELLKVCRRTLGDEHTETLRAISSLAKVLRVRGLFAEAEPLFREALDVSRRTLGDDDPDTLLRINHLGMLFSDQGNYAEAESLYREALDGLRSALNNDDTSTVAVLGNLGDLLRQRGKLIEAEALLSEVLEINRRRLGEEHPDTSLALNNLGIVFIEQGELGKAEKVFRAALDGWRQTLGSEHLNTLTAIGNLAPLLNAQGKLEEAESMLRELLETCRRVVGDEHPFTLRTAHNLGVFVFATGKRDEAETLLLEAWEGRVKVLGAEHPDSQSAKDNLEGIRAARASEIDK
jgi:serine/threonine protein kinase